MHRYLALLYHVDDLFLENIMSLYSVAYGVYDIYIYIHIYTHKVSYIRLFLEICKDTNKI